MKTAPSAERNRAPILEVLRPLVQAGDRALLIASGTGQHTAHFAAALPQVSFQPSERQAASFADIERWTGHLPNVAPPRVIDAAQPWPTLPPMRLVVCINMIHISPWAATTGLFAGAAQCLTPDGALLTYGPYRFEDTPFAESNARFDASLRARDSAWGIRALAPLCHAAEDAGLALAEVVPRPANNHCLIFRRA